MVLATTKRCTKCDETKLVSEFHRAKTKKNGHHTWCKECVSSYAKNSRNSSPKEYSEKRKKWRSKNRFVYALTHSKTQSRRRGHEPCNATEAEIKEAFSGYCDLCGAEEKKRKLHMDHCHETGKFRGWLCAGCNKGLGHFRDDPELLIRAAEYLGQKTE